MTEMRKDRRAPVSLKVKYRSATVDEFIEQFGADVSRGGIFIKTKKPLDIGALLKFEFQTHSGEPVIHGVGRVAWRRTEEHARPDLPVGMGIKFIKLDDHSRLVIERIESRHGPGSRFEQTESAELAAPISAIPPAAAPASPPPENSAGGRPTPLIPASAIPSDVPTAGIALPPGLRAAPLPGAISAHGTRSNGVKVAAGSALTPTFRPPPAGPSSVPPVLLEKPISSLRANAPAATPQAQFMAGAAREPAAAGVAGAQPATSRRAGPSPRSAARDASEFLASAISVGGVGHEVRSQARAQVERARRDPQSVDLASELFGDLSEAATNEPARENPLEVAPPLEQAPTTPQPSAAGSSKIPSIEELVNETGAHAPANGRPATNSMRASMKLASLAPKGSANEGQAPLSLGLEPGATLGDVPVRSSAARGSRRGVLPIVLALIAIGGGVAAYVVLGSKRAPASAVANTPPDATAAQPKAPAPDAPTGEGVPLTLTSTPAGAEVSVDGRVVGMTPVTIKLPPSTTAEVSVRRQGYAAKTEKVLVMADMPAREFALEALPYLLTIVSDPPGATVSVGTQTAESPAPLRLGALDAPVTVTIDKPGYQQVSRSVRPDEFREQGDAWRAEISIALTPAADASSKRRRVAPRATAARLPEPGVPEIPVPEAKPGDDAPPAPAAHDAVPEPHAPAAPSPEEPPAAAAPVEVAPTPAAPAPAAPAPAAPPAPAPAAQAEAQAEPAPATAQ